MKASDNEFPSVLLAETSAPSSPAASKRRLFVDTNHVLQWKDSGGLVSPLAALNKWNATTAPTTSDDSGDGYSVGSRWIDTTNDKEYVCLDATSSAAVWTETTGGGTGGTVDYILIEDQKSSGTAGGTFTNGAWRTRDLNTEVVDTGGNASLSSNQITLDSGTYRVRASAPTYNGGRHQIRLQNTTDATTLIVGTSEYASNNQTRSWLEGEITVGSSKALELQHQCEATNATNGFGVSCGGNFTVAHEVFSVIEFWKES